MPLLIVTMAGQNGPRLAVMRSSGYRPNDKLLLGGTGVASVLFAPFGSHAINLAAITASIWAGQEAHEDSRRRYIAGISCGNFYMVFGTFSTAVVALFAVIPARMLTALAGVVLLHALQGAYRDTVRGEDSRPGDREAILITLRSRHPESLPGASSRPSGAALPVRWCIWCVVAGKQQTLQHVRKTKNGTQRDHLQSSNPYVRWQVDHRQLLGLHHV